MTRTRQFLALLAGGIGTAAAILGAPIAAAAPDGGGGPNNPLMPMCTEGTDGGGEDTECASAGSSELSFSPNDLGIQGAMVDEIGGAFGGI